MSEFFFQIVLFLAGAVIGVIAQILKPLSQKILAGALAILLIAAASFWLGYEFAASQSKTALATPIRPPSPVTTPTTMQIPSIIFTPTSTPAKTTILSPAIPESPTVPASLFGTKYQVQMSTGITSPSKYQAIPIHFNFSNEDYGKNLCVYVGRCDTTALLGSTLNFS